MNFLYGSTKPKQEGEKLQICMRCGMVGHTTENCKNEIPSNLSLRIQLEKMENESLKYADGSWAEDDLGMHIPVDKRYTDVGKTWDDGDFCFNCGEFGHTAEECKEPTYEVIHKMVAPFIKDSSEKGIESKQRIVDALNKYHDSQEEK